MADTIKKEELELTDEWDKTFEKSEKTDHRKVTFVNRYGITLAEAGTRSRSVRSKAL